MPNKIIKEKLPDNIERFDLVMLLVPVIKGKKSIVDDYVLTSSVMLEIDNVNNNDFIKRIGEKMSQAITKGLKEKYNL